MSPSDMGLGLWPGSTQVETMQVGVCRLGAQFMEQLVVLLIRCWKTRRLDAMGVMRLANYSITGIIVGMLWWQVGQSNTLTRASDITAMLFFMIVRLFTSPAV